MNNRLTGMDKVIAICHGIYETYEEEIKNLLQRKPGTEGIERKRNFVKLVKSFYAAKDSNNGDELELPTSAELQYKVDEKTALTKLLDFFKKNSPSSRLNQNILLGLMHLLDIKPSKKLFGLFHRNNQLHEVEQAIQARISVGEKMDVISLDDTLPGKNELVLYETSRPSKLSN